MSVANETTARESITDLLLAAERRDHATVKRGWMLARAWLYREIQARASVA